MLIKLSQNTIHPSDDRVFSIRELMNVMTIAKSFKLVDIDEDALNKLTIDDKKRRNILYKQKLIKLYI